jgi:demethylmenaquinone methyltransferase/2-methoxy-6-polyprenyl-1,4-benzoquinol methylase
MRSPHGEKDQYIKLLLETDCLRDDLIRTIIGWLDLPSGTSGLDAGCGLGSNTLLLTEAVGAQGHVTGFDISEDFLQIAGERARQAGFEDRTDFRQGDVNSIPFGPDSFDWAWSADCIGPGTGDPFAQAEDLARVVRPGGSITILAWSTQNLLPGYPMLEARLNATRAGIAPFKQDMRPEVHLFRGSGWLAEAGLQDVTARSFVGDIRAPLDGPRRNALALLFDMRWGESRAEAEDDDWSLYKRLTDPESPDFIGDRPDYYGFFTYTVFRGWRKSSAV